MEQPQYASSTGGRRYTVPLRDLTAADAAQVGGKNASLGELIRALRPAGIRVPPGFATTARAYWDFLEANRLAEPIEATLARLKAGKIPLAAAGKSIRRGFERAELPPALAEAITEAYRQLSAELGRVDVGGAVRSSATAEDLPQASFAGQQETYLNVSGAGAVLEACRRCFASLFTDRAITYRETHGFDHMKVALSVCVQQMVRADKAGAGVMFTIDTETGFPDVVLINAGWGLGETVVRGMVEPDQYLVFKPLLDRPELVPIIEKRLGQKERKLVYAADAGGARGGARRGAGGRRGRAQGAATRNVATTREERSTFVLRDDEAMTLARWGRAIEGHYGQPMDIEWAKDGETGELAIVQARPETVQSRREPGALKTYTLTRAGKRLLSGLSIGGAIAMGKVCRLRHAAESERFPDGAILVTPMTDPDWLPIMKRASAIVTDHGGRTSHAAIVSRELGLPAVVGTGRATAILADGQAVTVSCAEGDEGYVYDGTGEFESHDIQSESLPRTRTKVMLIMANPAGALRWWPLPADGVGLARIEFIIGNLGKVHPLALVRWDGIADRAVRREIEALTAGYEDKTEYFVDVLAHGIAKIAAAFYPKPVIVRTSDFKTNEYAGLIGGAQFEPREENPMLGFRGAARYYSDHYRDGFALECRALKRVRDEMGLTNVVVMIPFCRSPLEADRVLDVLAANGLVRGVNGLEVYVMCELPSNVVLADAFASRFDGFSIGSNDLTQLVLGVDRDSEALAHLFDDRDEAVTRLIREMIEAAHRHEREVGLCGQAPSDHPDFARFLVQAAIDSISVTPDSFIRVKQHVAAAEALEEWADAQSAEAPAAGPERQPGFRRPPAAA
ncbi:MAG TPA: phosphoenolpyruvate synthase [Chloroflexota bacterium]|nr:phosphoenolpyruvate synthase [Chloroflexota bacterium]